MAIDLPPSTVRTTTLKHGAALVEAGLVTQAQLDAVLKNPTLSPAERKEAGAIVGAVRARAHLEPGKYTRGSLRTLAKFDAAVDTEASHAERVTAARGLLSRGEITESQFKGITSVPRSLRSTVELALVYQSTATEVEKLSTLHKHAGADTQAALADQLKTAETKLAALNTLLPQAPRPMELAAPVVSTLGGALAFAAIGAVLGIDSKDAWYLGPGLAVGGLHVAYHMACGALFSRPSGPVAQQRPAATT